MDKIIVQDLEFYGYHGVFPEERKLGQRFVVQLELRLDLRSAGRHDDLNETVNYAAVCELVKQIVEGPPFQLVEAVAEHLASTLLHTYAKIEEVVVRVVKPNPPVPVSLGNIAVEIRRSRLAQAAHDADRA